MFIQFLSQNIPIDSKEKIKARFRDYYLSKDYVQFCGFFI